MLKQVMNAKLALITMALVSTSTFAIAQSRLNSASTVPTPVGTGAKGITECDAGDSKCMEDKAKLEVKSTDGAIQPASKVKSKVQKK